MRWFTGTSRPSAEERRWGHGLVLVALLCVEALASTALAEEGAADAETGGVRVFLRFEGKADEIKALDASAHRFEAEVTRSSAIAFAGTAEMETIFADCRQAVGVDSATDRQCRLQAARRAFVEQVLEIRLARLGGTTYELTLDAWEPESNSKVFADYVEVDGADLEAAARAGLALLARRYLCHRGFDAACEGERSAGAPSPGNQSRGRLEIVDVSPAPVEVMVNGRPLAVTAPGQFLDLPVGKAVVTLRATGYEAVEREIELTAETMVTLSGIRLTPKPSRLAVRCDIEGAAIEVDGARMGDTRAGQVVEVRVPPGTRSITVRRDGYLPYTSVLGLNADSLTTIEVHLEPAAPATTATWEAPPTPPADDRYDLADYGDPVQAPEGGRLEVSYREPETPGASGLVVNTSAPSDVTVDDGLSDYWTGSYHTFDVAPGYHRVRVVSVGHLEFNGEVTVPEGSVAVADVVLELDFSRLQCVLDLIPEGDDRGVTIRTYSDDDTYPEPVGNVVYCDTWEREYAARAYLAALAGSDWDPNALQDAYTLAPAGIRELLDESVGNTSFANGGVRTAGGVSGLDADEGGGVFRLEISLGPVWPLSDYSDAVRNIVWEDSSALSLQFFGLLDNAAAAGGGSALRWTSSVWASEIAFYGDLGGLAYYAWEFDELAFGPRAELGIAFLEYFSAFATADLVFPVAGDEPWGVVTGGLGLSWHSFGAAYEALF